MTEVEGGRDVLAFKPNLMVERFRVRGQLYIQKEKLDIYLPECPILLVIPRGSAADYDFSFLTGAKKIAYEIRNNVYLLHATAVVFEGRLHYYYET